MTPPPAALATRTDTTRTDDPRAARRHEVALTDWCCENCEAPNPGRRRRCWDCRTTRY